MTNPLTGVRRMVRSRLVRRSSGPPRSAGRRRLPSWRSAWSPQAPRRRSIMWSAWRAARPRAGAFPFLPCGPRHSPRPWPGPAYTGPTPETARCLTLAIPGPLRGNSPASRSRGDHSLVHSCRCVCAGPESIIRLRCRRAADLQAIRRRATRAALRHDVRPVYVCERLPGAGLLVVARFARLSGRVAGPSNT